MIEVITLGCRLNMAESEAMRALARGEDDLIIVNSCAVTNEAVRQTRQAIRLHVWERGAGLTLACGTGACATAVAAIRRGMVASPVEVRLPGGDLTVAWAPGGTIRMSGPASFVFSGEMEL